MEQKKSQIFMFDLIFSLVILIVTLGVIFSYTIGTSTNDDIYTLNLQVMDSFTQTKINALNDQRIRDMFSNFNTRQLINIENTVAQQVTQFYHLGEPGLARNLSLIFVEPYVRNGYHFNLSLTTDSETVELYYVEGSVGADGNPVLFEKSKLSSRTQRSILGYINRTELYEGYVVRLDIWI